MWEIYSHSSSVVPLRPLLARARIDLPACLSCLGTKESESHRDTHDERERGREAREREGREIVKEY